MSLPFTLQQLRILKSVASEKSFTEASKILFVSQPNLSKQIQILENSLGILLLNRQTNSISLTEAGTVFLQYSERILALCEESCRALNDIKNGDRGSLKVGASQTIGTYLMPHILTLFTQHYPQIDLQIEVDSTVKIANAIINKQIDIAIVSDSIPKELGKKLKIESFIEDELILIVPKSYPFKFNKKNELHKEDLYHLNFITLNSTSEIYKSIETTLIKNNIETKHFNTIMRLNSIEAIKIAVSLGLGVAFVSLSSIEQEMELNSFKIIKIKDIKIKHTLSIITNPHCYHSQALEFFHKKLRFFKNTKI